MYSIQEEGDSIIFWRFNPATGRLTNTQQVSSLPPGFVGTVFTSEIRVSADGRFVYGVNGVSFVNVTQTGWDTHATQFDRGIAQNNYNLSNDLDRAVGSLVEDLRASGDLDSTLIVMMGEFGRTPAGLNSRGGRDHYRNAMSVAMIGGGILAGRVLGSTDSTGAAIVDPGWSAGRPIYPDDIAATIYSALGIDWTKTIDDTPSSRRFYYVNRAGEDGFHPVEEVFA